jgi:hypothetical protein
MDWWQVAGIYLVVVAPSLFIWSRSKGWQKKEEQEGAKFAPSAQAASLID